MYYVKFWFNIVIGLALTIVYVYQRALRERSTGEIFIPEFNFLIFFFSLISIIITTGALISLIRAWYRQKIMKYTVRKAPKNKIFTWCLIRGVRIAIWLAETKVEAFKNIISLLPKNLKIFKFLLSIYCNEDHIEEKYNNLLGFFSLYMYFGVRLLVGLCFFLDTWIYNNFWLFPKVVILYLIPIIISTMETITRILTKNIILDMREKYIIIVASEEYRCKPDYIGKPIPFEKLLNSYFPAEVGFVYINRLDNYRIEERIYRIVSSVLFLSGSYKLFILQCKSLYITHYFIILQIYDVVIQFFLEIIKYI